MTGKDLSVLVVVEDEDDMRFLIRMTLSHDARLQLRGEATTAEEAIAQAKGISPELIILDHSLSGELTGLQAAPTLKQLVPGSKILLFTAHDMRAEAAREPAIDAFLRKDNFKQLLPTVEALLDLEPIAS